MGEKNIKKYLVIAAAFLIQTCLGSIYAWSVFTPSLIDAGWTYTMTQLVFSTALVFYALAMVISGLKMHLLGPAKTAFLGGLVLASAYMAAALWGEKDFLKILIFIGVMGGSGIGIAYVVPISVAVQWFPEKKGLISGIAVAGFGLGAMLWIKLAGSFGGLIKNYGLSYTFFILGLIFFILISLASFFMFYPSSKFLSFKEKEAGSFKETYFVREFTPLEMLKSRQFWLLFFSFAFLASAGLMSIGLMKIYPLELLMQKGMSRGEARAVASTAMAVFFSLANASGRIGWGLISDFTGRKSSLAILAFLQFILVMNFSNMAGDPLLLYFAASFIGFNFGGGLSLFPSLTADSFGIENLGRNYPLLFLAYGLGAILGPNMGGILGDLGNFDLAFKISGFLCFMAVILILSFRPLK